MIFLSIIETFFLFVYFQKGNNYTSHKTLPKEKDIDSAESIRDVSEYLSRVSMYTEKRRQTDGIVVYRGEPDVYDQPCRPNIFRRGVLNSNCFFEKNLFDTMRQNKLYVSLHREEYGEADSNLFKKSDCYRGLMRELEQVAGENEREPQEDGGEDRKSSNTNRKVKRW